MDSADSLPVIILSGGYTTSILRGVWTLFLKGRPGVGARHDIRSMDINYHVRYRMQKGQHQLLEAGSPCILGWRNGTVGWNRGELEA